MKNTPLQIEMDIADIARIDAIPVILELICEITGMGFAAVARVTEDRWVACSVLDKIDFGLKPGGELQIKTTICNEIRQSGLAVTIDSVADDVVFRNHHTPAMYGFQSYISVPIVLRNGDFFGTLCAIDPQPARVSLPKTRRLFELWADLIAFHMDAHHRLAASEADLLGERQSAELREQFIAVLGHDLRNPIAAIDAGARILAREELSEKATSIVAMLASSARRSAGIIDNLMDFARGRLGGGISVQKSNAEPLHAVFKQVVEELRSTNPGRIIRDDIAELPPFHSDAGRLGQMLSNLIGNALQHGAADGEIRVRAAVKTGAFELSVSNPGAPIPQTAINNLFKPFFRGDATMRKSGLGLGLYIASEIAQAHQGTLSVRSNRGETTFTFRMPLETA